MNNSYFGSSNFKQGEGSFKPEAPADLTNLPRFVRTDKTGDKVYFTGSDGRFHWIKNPEALRALGGDFGDIVTIDQRISPVGDPIGPENAKDFLPDQESGPEPDSSPALEGKQEEKEFKTYDPEGIKQETKKGFTSIIILAHFNSYPVFHYTGNCVGSIREHTDYIETPYEIIMVLNGDTGIKLPNLKETKADKVIENKENLGFSKAVNQAIRCSSGEYIAIVNNDTMLFNGWLADMQESLKHLDLVMATPMYGEPFARAVEAEEKRNKWLEKPIQESFSDFRDFSCILTRKEMFNQIGVFNEEFFMYAEDLDLMRRMDKAGLKYASTRRVNTLHIIGATSSEVKDMPEIMNESKRKLKEIWGE